MTEQIDHSKIPLFSGLSKEWIAALLAHVEIVEFQAGDYVFQEGDNSESLYFMLEGRVELESKPLRGSAVVMDVLEMGDLLGWSACLSAGPFTASAQCRTTVKLARLDADKFVRCLREAPVDGLTVMTRIAEIIARRLGSSRERLSHLLTSF